MLLVQNALTRPAQGLALARMIELNPHLRGAHLSDVLDMLDQSDSFLGLSEPYWEQHGAALAAELGAEGHGVVTVSVDAAVLLLNYMQRSAESDPVETIAPPELVVLVDRLARAAYAGETETVPEPDPAAA
jgi:hypothetical protein